jgi:hypothetical protein
MATFQGVPGYVGSNTSTSGDPTRGLAFTRLKGPALAGTIADSVMSFPAGITGPGPIPPAGGYICLQSTASLTNQVVTTSAALQNASFVYIPVSTGSFVSSNNASQAAAPPYTGVGTPIVWNDAAQRLMVWSSGSSAWLSAPAAQAFTCSS